MDSKANDSAAIELREVSYNLHNGHDLLHDLSLTVQCGETVVLLGRSGSGKTTTLKLINRLLEASSGDILVDGRNVRDWDVIRLRRMVGYVIQEIGLFPHFTVERNISVVPNIEGWRSDRTRDRIQELLQLVGLDTAIAKRYPYQLSGGQRQRVGVARALAADPPFLLMDEPFGALDPLTRAELQKEFRSLQQRLKKTVVFVTHDLRESLLLGDRIALLDSGKLVTMLPRADFESSSQPLVVAYRQAFDSGCSAGDRK